MSSNSIRVNAALFEAAKGEGALMSRSAAQQIEHWARMGAALETCGLTVEDMAALLRGPGAAGAADVDADLWAFKRQRQRADVANASAGRVTQADLSWFSGGKARRVKLPDSPY